MTELAKCYDQAGRRDEALKLREEVLTLSRKVLGPEHLGTAEAMGWLAVSYQEADRRAEALKLWEEDLAVHRKVDGPNNSKTSGILNAMAWILATSAGAEIRNGSNAVKMAESAVGTYRGNPDLLDTLAAAYAEVQQFDKAVAVEQEAIGLAQNDQEKQDYVSRLKGYQDHKPFRDKVNR
jgi:tetratricopeptide (TPR) repeat protein